MPSWLVLLAVVSLAAPASAAAHLKSGTLSTDFEARVGSFHPAASGLAAHVLDGDQRLELRVDPARVVVVIGLLGEPFLRFSAAGVEANLASPTATSTHVIGASAAVSSSRVSWRRVSRGHVLAWHEGRLRPVQVVPGSPTGRRAVARWSIPLIVDGRRTTLGGTEWYAAGPPVWPWLLFSALAVALGGLGACLLSRRMQRVVASVALPLAIAAVFASWFGTLVAGRVTLLTVLFAGLFAAGTAFFLLVMVASAGGPAQLGAIALIGGFTATFALPEIAVFGHGFVLSLLPAFVARLMVAVAVVGGVVTATVCLPAVADLLAVPRGARR